jgi:hypothetical protein
MESPAQGTGDSDGARSSAGVAYFDDGLNWGAFPERPSSRCPPFREQRRPEK